MRVVGLAVVGVGVVAVVAEGRAAVVVEGIVVAAAVGGFDRFEDRERHIHRTVVAVPVLKPKGCK